MGEARCAHKQPVRSNAVRCAVVHYKVVQKDEESLSIVNCGVSAPEQEDFKDQGKY